MLCIVFENLYIHLKNAHKNWSDFWMSVSLNRLLLDTIEPSRKSFCVVVVCFLQMYLMKLNVFICLFHCRVWIMTTLKTSSFLKRREEWVTWWVVQESFAEMVVCLGSVWTPLFCFCLESCVWLLYPASLLVFSSCVFRVSAVWRSVVG